MPSVDHVRVVRMLVKHVHSFVYAKGPDMSHFSNFHSTDELRRYVRVEFLGKSWECKFFRRLLQTAGFSLERRACLAIDTTGCAWST